MITDDALRTAIKSAMDKRARAHPNIDKWTWQTAKACGVVPRTIEKWQYGETFPSAANLMNLCEHFGTPFKNEIEGLGSYTSARREHADAIEDANELARCKTAFVQIKGVIADAEAEA